MKFSPRIRDLGDQNIYTPDQKGELPNIEKCLKGPVNEQLILQSWDAILRLIASIKFGWVTSSLFISKLQAFPRKNTLTKALQEYGKLIKSTFIPNYLCSKDNIKKISKQLNKGEAIHDLRQFLFFANEGKIRKSNVDDQNDQASALTLITNAIIVWNTRYMEEIIKHLREKGMKISDEDLSHISPCRFDHINKYGKYEFNIEREFKRKELRTIKTEKAA